MTWRRRGESTTIREEGQSNLGGGEVVLHPGGHPHPPHQLLHAAAHLEGQVKLGVKIKYLPLYRDVALLHGDDDALRVDEEGGAEGDVLLRLGRKHVQNFGKKDNRTLYTPYFLATTPVGSEASLTFSWSSPAFDLADKVKMRWKKSYDVSHLGEIWDFFWLEMCSVEMAKRAQFMFSREERRGARE